MAQFARTLSLLITAAAVGTAGDARRGAMVMDAQQCLECHTVQGQGIGHEGSPRRAPDLGGSLTAVYSPSALASVLWNHTPAMWTEMQSRGVNRPVVMDTDWEDLFAYLYSLQFAERPAEVGRGKAIFQNRRCADCHDLAEPPNGQGKPVSLWRDLDDPVTLVYQMWNHASFMKKDVAATNREWPTLSARDFLDLTAYVQHIQNAPPKRHFALPEAESGRLPFEENCRKCHTGPLALENRLSNKTWLDIGARMWNHAPLMRPLPVLSAEDMRRILAFVWDLQYRGSAANTAHGRRVFEQAGCISCHRSPLNGAPMSPRSRKTFTPYSMVALGWGPARAMHQEMVEKGIRWPQLSPSDMTDLTAWLNSLAK